MIKHLAIIFVVLVLAGCGFQPLYGTKAESAKTSVRAQFDSVRIENIPDRTGQSLRNALMDRLYSSGRPVDPVYSLTIGAVREKLTDLDLTKSSDATRGQLRLDTRLTLKTLDTGETVLSRDLTAITSYNILSGRFTTRVSEENARANALDDLARQVENQLALYFARQ